MPIVSRDIGGGVHCPRFKALAVDTKQTLDLELEYDCVLDAGSDVHCQLTKEQAMDTRQTSGLEAEYDYILDSGDDVRYLHIRVEVTDMNRTRRDGSVNAQSLTRSDAA